MLLPVATARAARRAVVLPPALLGLLAKSEDPVGILLTKASPSLGKPLATEDDEGTGDAADAVIEDPPPAASPSPAAIKLRAFVRSPDVAPSSEHGDASNPPGPMLAQTLPADDAVAVGVGPAAASIGEAGPAPAAAAVEEDEVAVGCKSTPKLPMEQGARAGPRGVVPRGVAAAEAMATACATLRRRCSDRQVRSKR
mmetsp:Transcript_57173/g.162120  ORF Transcript_57173/g.162120 Transcript_57173/m.162120 type:complete len:198 (+) Transcript_57173:1072-1665(+)